MVMMMPKLNMKHHITIGSLQESSGPEAGGEEFQIFTTAWAAIRTLQGNEIQAAGITTPVENMRFIIRYIPGVESYMEIIYKDENYQIENIMNDNEDDKTLTIVAKKLGRG